MGIKTSSLEEVGDIMLTAFGDYRVKVLSDLFSNLMETTPEDTGTLKYNWRFKPGGSPGAFRQPNTGESWPEPEHPDDKAYSGRWKEFTIYNNSEYIVKVNNGEGGNEHNQNFIQRALAMTDAKF